jgi:signal transduction histidine kinase
MEHDPRHPTLAPIPAPPAFVERRRAFRRGEDLGVHEDRALLARALDILAGPGDATTQVAEILALAARVVGARRAAIVTDRPTRRALVVAARGEDPGPARELAAWLDADAARPAAVRAAAGPAEITVVHPRRGDPGSPTPPAGEEPLRDRLLRLVAPGTDLQLGLELVAARDAPAAAGRLPPATLRHLMAALAAASRRAADEVERRELRARERERELFVAAVVHELRTPLTGLGGYLDLLAEGALADPEIGPEFIERGRGIVERMAALVGDLLELSRVEAGSLRLELEAVSLAEACERGLAPLLPTATARGIRLAADLGPRIRTVRADRRRVEQIVTNLAGNACKFAPDGGLVEVTARVEGAVALLVVRDDGPGIGHEDRERVFRPFARLEGHERIPGTGLGLPISRDLARAMGGDVEVASVPGSGSAFILGLPAGPDVARTEVEAAVEATGERETLELEERLVRRAIRAGREDADFQAVGEPGPKGRRAGPGQPATEQVGDAA